MSYKESPLFFPAWEGMPFLGQEKGRSLVSMLGEQMLKSCFVAIDWFDMVTGGREPLRFAAEPRLTLAKDLSVDLCTFELASA